MVHKKIIFPCGLTYEIKGWSIMNTSEQFESKTLKEALSSCPIHNKKCR